MAQITKVVVYRGLPGANANLAAPGPIGAQTPGPGKFTVLTITDLPTEDPGVAGQLWVDGDIVKVSAAARAVLAGDEGTLAGDETIQAGAE